VADHAVADDDQGPTPHALLLTGTAAGSSGSRAATDDAHVPQPVVWQLPQPPAVLLMMLNELSMALLLSKQIG